MQKVRSVVGVLLSLSLIWTLVGCSSNSTPSVNISPSSVALTVGQTQQFTSSVDVTWAVKEGDTGGTITPSGLYTAPDSTGTFHVNAASVTDQKATSTATIEVTGITPQQPKSSDYAVVTQNYFYQYNVDPGASPFPAYAQFGDSNYPIPISYEIKSQAVEPIGFTLKNDTETALRTMAKADPRICAVSGVTPSSAARIRVMLEDTITYNNITNIIGLTTVVSNNVPCFTVEVATGYKGGGIYKPLTLNEVEETLTHELGHAFGLGHSPDQRDLMFWQVNNTQGFTYNTFLTYGDAMALWSTLNNKSIDWVPSRETVVQAPQSATIMGDTRATIERGTPVCVYTKH